MTINLILLGKLKEDYFKETCAEYEKRLSAYCKLNIMELSPVKISQNPSAAEIKAALLKEAEMINAKTLKSFKIALCLEGEKFTSEGLAKKLFNIESNNISFIIGSSEGLSDSVKQSADLRLSLSDMTFPHRLARIMLSEQLYRAFSIQNNGKYHK
ncbi:MAG: 23S rRNA (pseudouridine(1915)-N(3))-methyltransferase RlmH [Oscillospiraceae bacterium]|nr:23S rRNA (pseudouridine(1915)-N(3))-methyltransferase RlmH [Oscillospiraceae bacterium]